MQYVDNYCERPNRLPSRLFKKDNVLSLLKGWRWIKEMEQEFAHPPCVLQDADGQLGEIEAVQWGFPSRFFKKDNSLTAESLLGSGVWVKEME